MWNLSLRVSADPWALKGRRCLVKRPQNMKSIKIPSSGLTLLHLVLSHMDFLNDPAAIQWSKLIKPCATQDEKPNELTNLEILMKNHHKYIHSFGLILPAIFPDTDISSCVCVVLLFETSSSSHVKYHIARQRGPLGPERSIWACLTSFKHEICQNLIKWTDLVPPQALAYGFSRWPRCNPLKQVDHI